MLSIHLSNYIFKYLIHSDVLGSTNDWSLLLLRNLLLMSWEVFRQWKRSELKTFISHKNPTTCFSQSADAQLITNIIDANTKESFSESDEIARVFNKHFASIKCDAAVSDKDCQYYVNNCFRDNKRSGKLRLIPFLLRKLLRVMFLNQFHNWTLILDYWTFIVQKTVVLLKLVCYQHTMCCSKHFVENQRF